MDMSEDWADEAELSQRVPPIEDRLWAHPSELGGQKRRRRSKSARVLGGVGLLLLGFFSARAIWPAPAQVATARPISVAVGQNTSAHVVQLSKAIAKIRLASSKTTQAYGLAISSEGYILVPASALPASGPYVVNLSGRVPLQAHLIARDNSTDTAIIKVNTSLTNFVSGVSQRGGKKGQIAVAIGPLLSRNNPLLVLSRIEATGVFQLFPGGETSSSAFLADAAKSFNPKGLLFVDANGNPLGMGLYRTTHGWIVLPLGLMFTSAQKIELHDGVPTGWLGIVGASTTTTSASATSSSTAPTRGVTVFSVSSHSPAAISGILPKDQIVAIDGRPIHTLAELQAALAKYPSGSQITLSLIRNGLRTKIVATLSVKSSG